MFAVLNDTWSTFLALHAHLKYIEILSYRVILETVSGTFENKCRNSNTVFMNIQEFLKCVIVGCTISSKTNSDNKYLQNVQTYATPAVDIYIHSC